MIGAEVERRYGERADIVYHDVGESDVRTRHAKVVEEIRDRGLVYPVTVVDGTPLYDGAVSYPAILRAIESRLAAVTEGI